MSGGWHIADWQFWVATAVAAGAAAWLARYLWRIARPRKVRRTRATLTIDGAQPKDYQRVERNSGQA